MNEINDFFEEFGIHTKIEQLENSLVFRKLKTFRDVRHSDKTNENDCLHLTNAFFYYFGDLYIQDCGKFISASIKMNEENREKYIKILKAFYIKRTMKKPGFDVYLSNREYEKNNLSIILKDKEFLRCLSSELVVKSVFQNEIQMRKNLLNLIDLDIKKSLRNINFIERFDNEFSDILFKVLDRV